MKKNILMSFERSAKEKNSVDMGSSECSREGAEIKLDFEVNELVAPSSRRPCKEDTHNYKTSQEGKSALSEGDLG